MIPQFQRPVDAAPAQDGSAPLPYARGDWDFDYRPHHGDGQNGHELVAEPTSVGSADDLLRDQPDDNLGYDPGDIPPDTARARPPADSPLGTPNISMWTADYRARPWYRTKHAVTALAAAAVAATVVWGVLLVLRSPGTGTDESTTAAPKASTTAQPAPSSVQPTRAAPLPPPRSAATTTAPKGRADGPSTGGDWREPMATPRHTVPNAEARDRGDPHARHPGADQRGTTAAADDTRNQPRRPRRPTQAPLGLFLSKRDRPRRPNSFPTRQAGNAVLIPVAGRRVIEPSSDRIREQAECRGRCILRRAGQTSPRTHRPRRSTAASAAHPPSATLLCQYSTIG